MLIIEEKEKKLCPYCYRDINGTYGTVDADLPCPKSGCGKIIPKAYLQYPTKHVASIVYKKSNNIQDFGHEIADYAKYENAEGTTCRAEYYESADDNVKFILYEYLYEEFSAKTETVMLAIHKCVWESDDGRPANDIENASSILLNLDISELKALYFNIGIKRTREDFDKWQPRDQGRFVREVSEYLRRNQLNKRVAILFGNLQDLRGYAFTDEEKKYQNLLEIMQDWTSGDADRKWIRKANGAIRDLLMELGEERLINDADTMSDHMFFLYPSSKYRMTSNTFWMMAILLWTCIKIE